MTRSRLTLILVLAVGVGCYRSSESYVTSSPGRYARVPMDSVAVFVTMAELDRYEWEGIALIKSEFLIDPEEDQDWVDDLRKEAGRIGANAIVIFGPGDFGAGQRLASAFLGQPRYRTGDVIAVRLKGSR